MPEVICYQCGKKFNKKQSEINKVNKCFCSMKCYSLSQRKINKFEILDGQTAKIIFSENSFCLIDIEDIKRIKKYYWNINNKGYVYTNAHNPHRSIRLHRYLMNPPKNKVIDHINRNALDNRKINLKICTQFDNCQNKINRTNKISGVSFEKSTNKWFAYIGYLGKKINLGRFGKYELAIKARLDAECIYHNKELKQCV